MIPPVSNGLQFTTWSFLEFLECPIYSVKFLVVYYTSLDSGREDAGYFTLTFHVHNYVSTTNYNYGSMLYSDNRTNYGIAQRVANVTGQVTRLTVTYDQGKEWECPEIFTSQDED